MSDRPHLSVVHGGAGDPCYICGAEPEARCDVAWYLYARDTTRCPIRSGEATYTAAEAQLLRDSVQIASQSPDIHAELTADEPAWQERLDQLFDQDD